MDWQALVEAVAVTWRFLGDLLSPLVVPVTAGIATYVAYQQWRINRTRLRVELYDRRAVVFRSMKEYLSSIFATARVDGNALSEFVRASAEVDFLFDKRLATYLDEIYQTSVKMVAIQGQLQGTPVGAQRTALVNDHAELLLWMTKQPPVVSERFKKYLRVD